MTDDMFIVMSFALIPLAGLLFALAVADRNPNKPLDDIIHDEFHETWFQYHADGDDDW